MLTVLGSSNPQRLGVIARTSSMRLEETDISIREIGERLRVTHVVEGSMRRQGNDVRISATLIDAALDVGKRWTQCQPGPPEGPLGAASRFTPRVRGAGGRT